MRGYEPLVPSRVLGPASLVACALLAACGNSSSPSSGGAPSATSATPPPPRPPEPPSASPAVPPTVSSLPAPAPSISAVAPAPASASPLADAGAPRPHGVAAHDAGAADAGLPADAGAAASVSPAQQIAQQVDAIFAKKKTFFAHFKQRATNHATGITKDSTGVVFVERPNKISFRYDPPNLNRIVSDGVTLKVYMADNQQMIETPMAMTQYPGAVSFMLGNGIASSFTFMIDSRVAYSGVVLDGKPLTPDPNCVLAQFFIDRGMLAAADPGAIQRVLVLGAQSDKNRFDFTGATQPATIDPAEFTFTPPPGTNIITHP